MLTPLATGAAARPFKTHHNALDIDLYARIAPELYLKRLLVGGFEKVYELNRNFRNEGISTRHNPEFTMLEFYWAYADVNQMMDFAEQLIQSVVFTVLGHTHAQFGEHVLDFGGPFRRVGMKESLAGYVDGEIANEDVVELFETHGFRDRARARRRLLEDGPACRAARLLARVAVRHPAPLRRRLRRHDPHTPCQTKGAVVS